MSDSSSSEESSSSTVDSQEILNQYENFHIEMPYQIGIGKIYDPYLIESEKEKEYFAKEYELKATGVGNRVFPKDIISKCKALGELSYDPMNIDNWSEKYMGLDPAFYGSHFGVCICEVVNGDLRVLYAEEFYRKDTQAIIDKILDLRIKYRNIKNIFIDASQSEFIMDIKMYFDNQGYEYPDSYNEKIREWERIMNKEPWEMGMYIVPVAFNKRIELTQRLKKTMENGNYHIHPTHFEKLLLAYDTAVSKNLDVNDIDKEHTEYNDILDSQLCLFRRIKPI